MRALGVTFCSRHRRRIQSTPRQQEGESSCIYSFFPSLQQTGTSPSRRIIYFYCSAVGNKRQSIPPAYRPRGHTPRERGTGEASPPLKRALHHKVTFTRASSPPRRHGGSEMMSFSFSPPRLMTECRKCQEVPKWERI